MAALLAAHGCCWSQVRIRCGRSEVYTSGDTLYSFSCLRNVGSFRRGELKTPIERQEGHLSTARLSVYCVSDSEGHGYKSVKSTSRRQVLQAVTGGLLLSFANSPFSLASAPTHAEELGLEQKERAIRAALRKVVTKPKAAGVLRLSFHDAATYSLASGAGGMNGSVLMELERPESAGLKRAIRVLEKVRLDLEPALQVSWADMIALAGAEAIEICGGPHIKVPLGRLDKAVADEEGQMPAEDLSAAALREAFHSKGFSTQEMVALLGSHTLGNKGFGDPVVFDNTYYKSLLLKPWASLSTDNKMASMIGIPTDHVIADDKEALIWIELYANDQEKFFQDFSSAYRKMINLGATFLMGDEN